ncbi:O-antigen ligase family protein [Chitinophaga caseinilytica]|uniref:O-antigen ligase family protein n=1 Tax=Chitinophaga caseinilytica TaxID=2267521 RepID=A0ABZ2YZG4_9BACT
MKALTAFILRNRTVSSLVDTPYFWVAMALVAGVIGYVVSYIDERLGLVIAAGLIGITVALICLFNTRNGFYIVTVLGFFMFYIKRFADDAIPMGAVCDVLLAVTFLGIYYRKTVLKERLWKYSSNIITLLYGINFGFLMVELFNPSMYSVAGWVFTVRKALNFIMIYFIGLHIFHTRQAIIDYVKLWVILSAIAGLYGCYQQWFGLLGFETNWVMSDPIRYKLYFQGGEIRKFSFLSDPTSFGILMAHGVVFSIILLLNAERKRDRKWLFFSTLCMALGMAYSGTRTAYFMIPAGLSLYVLMTITNRRTMFFAIGFMMLFCVLIFGPFYSNGTINRIRSTFEMSDDESLNVRDENRAKIQPYIFKHPLGGGVATSGVLGLEYNPEHPLAGFPPDSGYLRVAIETGWVGLILTCTIYFTILFTGIRNYYRSRSREFKIIYLGIVASIYAYIIANYAQVAIGQIPGALFFYSAVAMIVNLRGIEEASTQNQNSKISKTNAI